jgi:hypothetical protein
MAMPLPGGVPTSTSRATRSGAMATNPPSPRPRALVTGASAGIGRALVEDHQVDLALLEHAGGLDEVSPGAPEPVELGDYRAAATSSVIQSSKKSCICLNRPPAC